MRPRSGVTGIHRWVLPFAHSRRGGVLLATRPGLQTQHWWHAHFLGEQTAPTCAKQAQRIAVSVEARMESSEKARATIR
jgi:hypothetical protein